MTDRGDSPRPAVPARLPLATDLEEPFEDPVLGGYFVSAYPPFSYWSSEALDSYSRLLVRDDPNDVGFGLYLHVPFCAQRCHYCYYLSHDDRPGEIDRYLATVVHELELYAETPYIAGRLPEFVYIGGGTPSLLSEARVRFLLESMRRVLPWTAAREVTFECAPRSVTPAKLTTLRELGVTRISLGAQQLDDEVLRLNGRIHQVEDIERAYEEIRRTGFDVVNVDLIVGLLGESDRSFQDSLGRVLKMEPDSVTLYQLEIPFNTPLSRSIREGTLDARLPGWGSKRERLNSAFDSLEAAGYKLRSGYTAVRDPERHNFVYQDEQYLGADLLGVGVSSFSYLGGVHHQNIAALGDYLGAVEESRLPLGRAYALSNEERFTRELVLQLKLGSVDGRRLRRRYGLDARERLAGSLESLVERGLLTLDGESLALTREGLLRVDGLLRELYLPEHRQGLAVAPPAGHCVSTVPTT